MRLQVWIIWDICQFILIFFGLYSYIDYFQSPHYITCIVTWHTNAWLKCLNFVMLYASNLIRSIVWWWIHDKITLHNITNVRANKYFQHFINNFTRSEQNGKRHPRMPISPCLRLSLRFWRQASNWQKFLLLWRTYTCYNLDNPCFNCSLFLLKQLYKHKDVCVGTSAYSVKLIILQLHLWFLWRHGQGSTFQGVSQTRPLAKCP